MAPASYVFLLSLLMGILSLDEEEPEDLLKSICGRPAVSSGISSGWKANVGQWPWQVSIRQDLFHVCGATLISEQWVLTAASCFWSKDARRYSVLVGSLWVFGHPNSRSTIIHRPASRSTIIPVSRIIFYPDFQEDTSSAIAVVELTYPVSFSPVVLPICLPSSAAQLKNSTSCWVTRWGYSGIDHYIKPSYTLKELKVLLLDLQTCSDYYHKKSLLRGGKPNISEAVICSKFLVEQLEQCGSRGDPLVCKVEDFWVLAGVMSWESNCTHEPGIYTNISFYKSWIEKSAISVTGFSAVSSWGFFGLFPVRLMLVIFLVLP